jgi:ADP-ribose pyrophosphatase
MPDKNADFTEEQLASELVYQGGFLKVYRDEVRLPDGRKTLREYIRHPGAVMMVPMLDDGNVVMVRQYRYPLGRHFIEIPAGKIDPGEAPLETARRELREECGYMAGRWRHLRTIHPCIGYSDERIELYLARDLEHVGHAPDDGEFLEVIVLPLVEALAWVRDGRITEVKSVIGLTLVAELLRGA